MPSLLSHTAPDPLLRIPCSESPAPNPLLQIPCSKSSAPNPLLQIPCSKWCVHSPNLNTNHSSPLRNESESGMCAIEMAPGIERGSTGSSPFCSEGRCGDVERAGRMYKGNGPGYGEGQDWQLPILQVTCRSVPSTHRDGPGYREGQDWQLPILQGTCRSVPSTHRDGPGYTEGQHWQLPILQGTCRSVERVARIRATPLILQGTEGQRITRICIFVGLVLSRPVPCSRADRFLPTLRVIRSEKMAEQEEGDKSPSPHFPPHLHVQR